MERKDLATPPTPRKNSEHMGSDLNQYCRYNRCKSDCKILKKDIGSLIQIGFLKEFVVRKEWSRTPHRGDKNASPKRRQEGMRAKNRTHKAIGEGFPFRRETSDAREVYASYISGIAMVEKRPKEEGKVVISFSKADMEHVTCPQENALVIIAEIDIKRVHEKDGED